MLALDAIGILALCVVAMFGVAGVALIAGLLVAVLRPVVWWAYRVTTGRPWPSPRGQYVRVPLAAEVRARVIANAGFRCQECGSPYDLTVDHITPVSHGGTNSFDNLQCLCRHCNSVKGTHMGW